MNFLTNLIPKTQEPRVKKRGRQIEIKTPQEIEIMRQSA